MFVLLTSLALCHSVLSLPTKVEYDVDDLVKVQQLFKDYIVKYDKLYAPGEESQRFLNFRENLLTINRKNEQNPYAYFDINHSSDLTIEEWKATSLGSKSNWNLTDASCQTLRDPTTHDAPPTLDWRQKNVVTPIKNQLLCGSCWAFSATGNVEAQYAMKYGQQILLSEQQLVDCVSGTSCDTGGNLPGAFAYLLESGGQEPEADYPYTAQQGGCQYDKSKVNVKLTGCNVFQLSGEAALKELLYKTGPLSISVAGSPLRNNNGGILTNCEDTDIDHDVLLVGYGSENGQDFWILKNSWGTSQGEEGYNRILRGTGCIGIGTFAACSIVA